MTPPEPLDPTPLQVLVVPSGFVGALTGHLPGTDHVGEGRTDVGLD